VLILITSGRPVLFIQKRVGLYGTQFDMYKFRTMINNAIEVGQTAGLTEDPFGVIEDDSRITRARRFLRRTSLDELPQLFNVLRGEMALVGPLPDVPDQVLNFTDDERRRLEVKPGITGWAQVNGRDDLPWPQRFRLDVWYVNNRYLVVDAKILLMTLKQFSRPESVIVVDDFNIQRRQAVDKFVRGGVVRGRTYRPSQKFPWAAGTLLLLCFCCSY
jgi:sugar transferase EpsL